MRFAGFLTRIFGTSLLIAFYGTAAYSYSATQPASPPTRRENGTVHAPAFIIPFSSLASAEAKRAFIARAAWREHLDAIRRRLSLATPKAPLTPKELVQFILEWRVQADHARKKMVQDMERIFQVTIFPKVIGGVQTYVVMPHDGIAQLNRPRVLINLHGGGMIFGWPYEGLVMSIPIASLGNVKVVTVDYRMAPEHRFPAASEDVAAVYAALLQHYRPENIGIYGCSAGGSLTAQSVAWFQHHNLPRPGAIGILCAGAGENMDGDSYYLAPLTNGLAAPTEPGWSNSNRAYRALRLYYDGANVNDPLISPVSSRAVLQQFPPTLFINSTRDPTMSSAIYSHRMLVKAGVDAELYLWDGLGHAFMYDARLPESREAYEDIIKFFNKHLGSNIDVAAKSECR